MKSSIKCFIAIFVLASVYCFITTPMARAVLMNKSIITAFAYYIGGTCWTWIPCMINYWLSKKRGHFNLPIFSLVTFLTSLTLMLCFFGTTAPAFSFLTVLGLIIIPVTLMQLAVLRFVMKIHFRAAEQVQTDNEDTEIMDTTFEKV